MLKIDAVSAGYGDLKVLFDVSMHVDPGEVVSIVGANGAGKTTLLRILSGLEPVTSGSVTFDGVDLLSLKPAERASHGIAHISQGRGILQKLSVRENLELGSYHKAARPNSARHIERAFSLFPILKDFEKRPAGQLSGGQQQMLAISRALAMEPKLIMMDEPSLGLSPKLVLEVFDIITNISKENVAILLVEQNLFQALNVSSRGYVLETGHIVMQGPSQELLNDPGVRSAYLGI